MVCTLLISKQEAEARHKQSVSIDSELSQLFTDVESTTGQTYILLDYKKELWSWLSFRKKSCTVYSLLYFTGFEYQYINFGPYKLGDSSISHYVTRQAIAGYLFGVLNGWNHAMKPATAPARGEGMSERDPDSNDCEFIECDRCGKVLNGLSLWVVGDKDPKTICEECYKLKESNERFTKNTDA